MGMHLAFWKYKKDVYLDNQAVYENACCQEKIMEGLENLPVDEIINKVSDVFSSWEKLDKYNYESKAGGFSVCTTEQTVLFDCSGICYEDLNKIIDIMLEYDCPYYDPQISVRFDGKG